MQVKKTTIAVVVITLLLLLTTTSAAVVFPTKIAFAQDEEGVNDNDDEDSDTIEASVSAEEEVVVVEDDEEETETTNNNTTTSSEGPQGYQDVSRAEVIDSNGNIQNPGGAGNENINLTTTSLAPTMMTEDDSGGIVTRPTNLEEMVVPQSVQSQNYADIKIALQAAGYAIADMQYTLEYGTGIPVIIVRGVEGVMTQPNMMDLEGVGAAYGFALRTHLPIGGAWQTTFESVTGSQLVINN